MDIFDRIKTFFDWVYTFFTVDIYTMLQEGIMWIIGKLTILYFELKLEGMKLAWGVAKPLIENLHISDKIASALSALPPDYASLVAYLKLPDAINIILAGFLTRFILRWTPL